jgi:hypothetical protein
MAWSGYLLENLLTGCGLEFGGAEIAQGAVQAGAVEPAEALDEFLYSCQQAGVATTP